MSPELLQFLPQQWVGIFAILMFLFYILMQIVEKSPKIAKLLPFGTWWHERQQNKRGWRTEWLAQDNLVIQGLQEQISGIVAELQSVRQETRSLTAFSVYDARWHHRDCVERADARDHLDYFAFNKLWRDDPVSASRLPV